MQDIDSYEQMQETLALLKILRPGNTEFVERNRKPG